MSQFVKDHVTRVFRDAGYELLDIHGDRGGIVQGDGLHLVVSPDIAAAARRFSADPAVIAGIEKDAQDSLKLRISLYGGSASADREGVWLSAEFIDHLRDECSGIYYKAQRDVNAIFDAEDAPDREWNGRDYVGVVDEFAMEIEENVFRLFVRVYRVADQSFNAYGSGDEEADRWDAASIIDGSASHGTVEVHLFEIDADDFVDGKEVFHPFSAENFDGKDFVLGMAEKVVTGKGLIWTRDSNDAYTLELAAELLDRGDDEQIVADALIERAIARGLPQDSEVEADAATRIP
jgi:hypothetical protein